MTAMDEKHGGPPISSEDVNAIEAEKHVESRDRTRIEAQEAIATFGIAAGTGLLAFMLGLGLGLGVMAFATPDQVRANRHWKRRSQLLDAA